MKITLSNYAQPQKADQSGSPVPQGSGLTRVVISVVSDEDHLQKPSPDRLLTMSDQQGRQLAGIEDVTTALTRFRDCVCPAPYEEDREDGPRSRGADG